jgi:hypothetical protein
MVAMVEDQIKAEEVADESQSTHAISNCHCQTLESMAEAVFKQASPARSTSDPAPSPSPSSHRTHQATPVTIW